jgi:hypothetical protein
MTIVNLENKAFSSVRSELRKEVIDIFLSEEPGTGKNELASRYQYITKRVGNNKIYLSRPAQFNNGFDFTLNVSDINFNNGYYNNKGNLKRSTTRPSHQHILDDLISKRIDNLPLFKLFMQEIKQVYDCQIPQNTKFEFVSGYDSQIILECIKWLFIEQDVTYWNYSGRSMFFNRIISI